MDLTADYLGMTLKNPLVPSASPLSEKIATIRHLEDSGAGAIVLHSLFEEQIRMENLELNHHLSSHKDVFSEAQSFFPEPTQFHLDPEGYLEYIQNVKKAVSIPVIASLNGATLGGWTDTAELMQQAGADAIELNIYKITTNPDQPAAEIEAEYVKILKSVKSKIKIPVALKLSPYFTNMANMAQRFDDAGANALVLFNRFYQPDIDLETLDMRSDILFSAPQALRLPLTWVGILFGKVRADLAATSGIHRAEDVLKMLMVGANVTMLCSVLLRRGPAYLKVILEDMKQWMEEHEYESVQQMRGSMSQMNCDNPSAYERAQYIKSLQSFKPQQ